MRKPGLREQINKIYDGLSLPEGSKLLLVAEKLRDTYSRERNYQGKSWEYRAAESKSILGDFSKIASQEQIGSGEIKSFIEMIHAMDTVVLSYLKPEGKRVKNKEKVAKAIKENSTTLEEIARSFSLPREVRDIYDSHEGQRQPLYSQPFFAQTEKPRPLATLERVADQEYMETGISSLIAPAISEAKASYSIWQSLKNWNPLGKKEGHVKTYRIGWLAKIVAVGAAAIFAGYVSSHSPPELHGKMGKLVKNNAAYASQFFESVIGARDNLTHYAISQIRVGAKEKGYLDGIIGTEPSRLEYSTFFPTPKFKS